MSQSGQQRDVSPLLSDRGTTIISDTVVSSLAGMAAREVEGVHMGGGAARTAGGVRRRITDRIQSMTGLRIKERSATITDRTGPEKEVRRRIGSRSATRERDASTEETATAQPAAPDGEPEPGASEHDTTQVETRSQPESETTLQTEASEEGRREETADLRSGDTRTEEQPTGETSEEALTRAETETSEPAETSAEARRRRRAEERARRRRRTEDS